MLLPRKEATGTALPPTVGPMFQIGQCTAAVCHKPLPSGRWVRSVSFLFICPFHISSFRCPSFYYPFFVLFRCFPSIFVSSLISLFLFVFLSSVLSFRGFGNRSNKWATGWMTGVQSQAGAWEGRVFFTTASRPALGPTQPPIQWAPGGLTPAVKRPGREVDQSPPSSAEVKNSWSYTSTPL
jgi:hypothetical protein